jgi:hypothetical protein
MSVPEANEVLARSVSQYIDGMPVLDLLAALNPIGGLGISLDGRTGPRIPITGSISVPGLDQKLLTDITAMDALGRNFRVNLIAMDQPMKPLDISFSDVQSADQSWSSKFVSNYVLEKDGLRAAGDAQNWTTGSVVKPFGWSSPWSMAITATQIQGSPWLNFSGMFGRIDSSTMLETSLIRKWNTGYWLQVSGIQTSTRFSPGLVTDVSDIYSAFAVAGWNDQNWSVYGGIQPYVISGSVDLRLPSRVDAQGVLHYSDHRVNISTPLI